MKIFLLFLLAVFFTASFSSSSDRRPRALPLFVACTFVAFLLASFRSVSS
jgi:hypothetical protein